jgi:hypothetical protein
MGYSSAKEGTTYYRVVGALAGINEGIFSAVLDHCTPWEMQIQNERPRGHTMRAFFLNWYRGVFHVHDDLAHVTTIGFWESGGGLRRERACADFPRTPLEKRIF